MIWATGDCHGNFERFKPEYFPEQAEMTKEDIVIICGDFGGVWFGDSRDDDDLDWLERLPFTLAFVDGNHENYDAIAAYHEHTRFIEICWEVLSIIILLQLHAVVVDHTVGRDLSGTAVDE